MGTLVSTKVRTTHFEVRNRFPAFQSEGRTFCRFLAALVLAALFARLNPGIVSAAPFLVFAGLAIVDQHREFSA